MNMLLSVFGYFDWLVLISLLLINYFKWQSFPPLKGCTFIIALIILFGFSLPIISMFIEIKLNSSPGDEAINLLYTYFKFPIYWVLGIIQLTIIYFKQKKAS